MLIIIRVDVLDVVVQVSLVSVGLPVVTKVTKFLICASACEEVPAVRWASTDAVGPYVAPQLGRAMGKVAKLAASAGIINQFDAVGYFVVWVSDTLRISSLTFTFGSSVFEKWHLYIMA